MNQRLVRRLAVIGTCLLTAGLVTACDGGKNDNGGMDPSMPGMDHGSMTSSASSAAFNGTDVQFATDMIAHHQGAIEMATTEQRQGQHAQAKQLASTIATSQAGEVTGVQGLLGTKS